MDSQAVEGGGGTEIRVDSYGPEDARPIVLLHGYSQSRLAWREQYRSALTEDYRLVVPDLRGHGESGVPRDAYDDPEQWAADVEAVLDSADARDAVLVAWSYAGLVALDYVAERGTDRLAGLVFVDAVASIGTDAAASLGGEYVGLMGGLTSTDAEESVAACEALVRLCRADEPAPDEFYTDLGYTASVPPHVRDSLRSRVVDHEDVLGSLDVPVLLLQGAEDAVVLAETAERYSGMVPDGELMVYDGVGHSPFREVADRFESDLRAFVDSL